MRKDNRLLLWQKKTGAGLRTSMPWYTKNAYKIWVSEIMLQQTQVDRVREFYPRFIKRFPDIHCLAEVNEDEVLSLWAGLGYYARARNMHKAAILVVEKYNGVLPIRLDELCLLPGIGKSTAGAILSMSINAPHPVLDVNVKRVLIRRFAIEDAPGSSQDKKLWDIAQQLMPNQECGDYNRGMMNLGSQICRAQKPTCSLCPFKKTCLARELGLTERLPVRPQKTEKTIRPIFFALIMNRQEEILLEKRVSPGIWGGLYAFPCFDQQANMDEQLRGVYGDDIAIDRTLIRRRHVFSHCAWDIQPVIWRLCKKINPDMFVQENGYLWYDMKVSNQRENIPFPGPVADIIQEITDRK